MNCEEHKKLVDKYFKLHKKTTEIFKKQIDETRL